MHSSDHQPELREALSTLQQYFSDSIPPLLAAKSVAYLMNAPADLIAAEIDAWIASQCTSQDSSASYSDYLFHALRKLYEMGQLELVPAPELNNYLEHLKGIVVARCPIEERELARDTLSRLGEAETTLSSTVAFLHKPMDRGEAGADDSGAGPAGDDSRIAESAVRNRRLSLLLERLEKEPNAVPMATAVPEKKEERVSQVIAAAASNAITGSELRQVQQAMAVDGVVPETNQIFRMLSRSLPGWVIPVSAESETVQTSHMQNSALEAMRRMIQLAENEGKGGQRAEELVD
jgi:hypothetical protein